MLWQNYPTTAGTAVRLELWDGAAKVADFGVAWSATGRDATSLRVPVVPPGNNYRIRATSEWDSDFFDESDAPFSLTSDDVLLKSNNSGKGWNIGTVQTVNWETTQLAGTVVDIELWRHGGKIAELATSWNPNRMGSIDVTMPDLTRGTGYTLRAISAWNGILYDESDMPFEVLPPILRLDQPVGGNNWQVDSSQSIVFTKHLDSVGVRIQMELWNSVGKVTDLGQSWVAASDVTESIQVPDVPAGSDYFVRIVSIDAPQWWDQSDIPITISPKPPRNAAQTWTLY